MDEALKELKHSVYTHLLLQGGPNPQLCVFLSKLLDIMDDMNIAIINKTASPERAEQEILDLSFHIIESLVIWLTSSLDDKKTPPHVGDKLQNLLLLVSRSRKFPDRIAAKNIVLRGLAELIRILKEDNPKIQFPDIKDSKDNIL